MQSQEEVTRHLLMLTETVKAYHASLAAMKQATRIETLADREAIILKYWHLARQAEHQYLAAADWLLVHGIAYTFDQTEKRYIQLPPETLEPIPLL